MSTVTILGNNRLTVAGDSVGVVPRFARLARATILPVASASTSRRRARRRVHAGIIVQHVLLNAIAPLIVLCTLLVPTAILTAALLGSLGLGITEPTPTWGNMINAGQLVLVEAPWLTLFPALAIVLTVLAFNLLGDAVRDALDPAVRDLAAPVAPVSTGVPRPVRGARRAPASAGAIYRSAVIGTGWAT